MDKLTGFHSTNADNDIPDRDNLDPIRLTSKSEQKIDSNSMLPFLESSFNNPKHNLSKSSLGHFSFAVNLDPTEVSDEEFFQASKQLNNEDFVRAAVLAYWKREPALEGLMRLRGDVEGHKDGRRLILSKLRNSSHFMRGKNSHWINVLIIKPIREVIRKWYFYLLKIVRKIIGIDRLQILDVKNLIVEQDELLFGARTDISPASHDKRRSQYFISGWVLAKDYSQTCMIRLVCNGKLITEVPLTVFRPGVFKVYSAPISTTHKCGYQLWLNSKQVPDQGILQIQAAFVNGSIVPVGLIGFRKF